MKKSFVIALGLVVVYVAFSVAAMGQATNVTTNTFGSGKHYKTSVERQTQGELSADDLHQASLLTS
jgi:hypothetical protein